MGLPWLTHGQPHLLAFPQTPHRSFHKIKIKKDSFTMLKNTTKLCSIVICRMKTINNSLSIMLKIYRFV